MSITSTSELLAQSPKRKHAKMPLIEILKEATPKEGVHWIHPYSCFEVQWDLFVPFYHRRANSTSKPHNIANRFTRPRNGFQRDTTRTPGEGYDSVYSFSGELPSKPAKPGPAPQEASLLGSLFEGDEEISLLKVSQRLVEKFRCSPKEMNNVMTVLLCEVIEKRPNTHISKEEFDCFLRRFGPIDLIIDKMRDFISSGANDWYHGNISRETSETLLKEYLKTNPSAFLIRAKSSPGQNVAFVISFGFSSPSPPQIYHTQIFSIHNKLVLLVQNEKETRQEVLTSVIQVLDFLNPKPQFAVPSPHFKFLVEDLPSPLPFIDNYLIPEDIPHLINKL